MEPGHTTRSNAIYLRTNIKKLHSAIYNFVHNYVPLVLHLNVFIADQLKYKLYFITLAYIGEISAIISWKSANFKKIFNVFFYFEASGFSAGPLF